MQREVDAGQHTAAVKKHVDEAYALGITGVPTYILNDKFAIVGAQPYEVFEQVMAQLMAEAEEAEP